MWNAISVVHITSDGNKERDHLGCAEFNTRMKHKICLYITIMPISRRPNS